MTAIHYYGVNLLLLSWWGLDRCVQGSSWSLSGTTPWFATRYSRNGSFFRHKPSQHRFPADCFPSKSYCSSVLITSDDSKVGAESLRFRGGHSSFVNEKILDDSSISTAAATISSKISSKHASIGTVPYGGKLQQSQKAEHNEKPNTTKVSDAAVEKKAALSAKAVAKQEAKEQKRKEKEQKKRHKQIAKQLRNRTAMNKRRKFMHAAWGMLFATLNHVVPTRVFVPGMAILTTGTLVMELLRYREGFEWMNEALHTILGQSLRKSEMDGRFTGSLYYFLGVLTTASLYPKSCATLGICQLAIADPTASYFGRATRHVYWSRIGNGLGGLGRNKGILGFLGGAVACVPLNCRLLSLAKYPDPTGVAKKSIFFASLLLGFAGAFADLIVPTPALTLPKKIYGVAVPPFHVDDNFVVPIVSGYACQQIFKLCGWPTDLELAKFLILR